jgi:cysteine desulfurase/selenocysteine lyase
VNSVKAQLIENKDESMPIDVVSVRHQFPILSEVVKEKPLVYLDNAASSQKPECVIQALVDYYHHSHANVHRGVHTLSERATDAYENSRERCRHFINAAQASEIIFVRGATEGINLAANSFADAYVKSGDTILVTEMEHHSNIVPWQMACHRKGAQLKVVPMLDSGELDLDAYHRLLEERPALVALTHVSNALGSVNPVAELVRLAHIAGSRVLVDGAQSAPHVKINVQALGCDFFVFSGHKLYAPTGIGVVYGRQALLEEMPPWQGGGEMIREVTFEHTEYNVLPWKFEAGTPNIAGAVGLAAAMDFMDGLGLSNIAAHEADLLDYATALAAERPWFRIIGTAPEKAGVLSFVMEGVHSNDVGMMLDAEGIAVRTGHHCAMPVMQHYGVPSTVRASLAVYNSRTEIEALFRTVDKIHELLA